MEETGRKMVEVQKRRLVVQDIVNLSCLNKDVKWTIDEVRLSTPPFAYKIRPACWATWPWSDGPEDSVQRQLWRSLRMWMRLKGKWLWCNRRRLAGTQDGGI